MLLFFRTPFGRGGISPDHLELTMGNLTVKQIDNARPKDKPCKLTDGDGLQLRIATDGARSWLVRYTLDGKERQYRLPEL